VSRTVWILTEERPKKEVVGQMLEKFFSGAGLSASFDTLRIIPVLDEDGIFGGRYRILGVSSPAIDDIFLRIISGNSSFVDYLVYHQDTEPTASDRPAFAVEETKTDDAESRNTGVFQRATKFVYLDIFYPGIDKTMLYHLQVTQKAEPTQTNIFGTRCFRTIGVQFLGKTDSEHSIAPFSSIDELIAYKAQMRRPPAGNVPILITKESEDLITVSGRLFKAGGLAHDPNIGALSLISATLRELGWKKRIMITKHGLSQAMVRSANKFVQIADFLDLELEDITLPEPKFPDEYWRYETTGEKLGTIFVHLVVEEFSEGFSIYENHAGCERGYFFTAEGEALAVGKRMKDANGAMPKDAEKIAIPDLIVRDVARFEIVNIEGERASNVRLGLEQLQTFGNIEQIYLRHHYPDHEVVRTVVLYGGDDDTIDHAEVSLLLNSRGRIVLGTEAPEVFKEAIANLTAYWRSGANA
jgi:hypothetical protein